MEFPKEILEKFKPIPVVVSNPKAHKTSKGDRPYLLSKVPVYCDPNRSKTVFAKVGRKHRERIIQVNYVKSAEFTRTGEYKADFSMFKEYFEEEPKPNPRFGKLWEDMKSLVKKTEEGLILNSDFNQNNFRKIPVAVF